MLIVLNSKYKLNGVKNLGLIKVKFSIGQCPYQCPFGILDLSLSYKKNEENVPTNYQWFSEVGNYGSYKRITIMHSTYTVHNLTTNMSR